MPLLTGLCSAVRFRITLDGEPDFDAVAFQEIPPGSEVRRSRGFVPMKPGEPYQVGAKRWAGKLRIDDLRPDPVAVRDRLEELIRTELEAGAQAVGPKKRKQLRELAEEELVLGTQPTRRYVEWAIVGSTLYVGSTNKSDVGEVMATMRAVDVDLVLVFPWEGLAPMAAEAVEGEARGVRFLRQLFEAQNAGTEKRLAFEREAGAVRMAGGDVKISLTGDISGDVAHHLEQGAEITSAKLWAGKHVLTLDAERWWVKGARLETERQEHWTDGLDTRLEALAEVYAVLDEVFRGLLASVEAGARGDGRVSIQETVPGTLHRGAWHGQEVADGYVIEEVRLAPLGRAPDEDARRGLRIAS